MLSFALFHMSYNHFFINIYQVDAIVSSTTKTLKLNEGAVSKSLLKKGGKSIQQECSSKYSDGISEGDIAITSGGKLQCKKIYHTYLPPWNGGKNKMVLLKNIITQSYFKNVININHYLFGTKIKLLPQACWALFPHPLSSENFNIDCNFFLFPDVIIVELF